MNNKAIISGLLAVIGLIVFGGSLESCGGEEAVAQSDANAWVHVPEGYVGAEKCATCHQQEYDDWMGSHHQMAMLPATNENVLGDFNNVDFQQDAYNMRFFMNGEKHMVNAIDHDSVYKDLEVLFTFGFEPLQQYLVDGGDGKLQALTVAWNSEENKWMDLYPELKVHHSEWLSWSGNSMTWNAMCADCHSTAYRKNFDIKKGQYASTWAEVNVACEACHGPGKEHIALATNGSESRGSLSMTTDLSQVELVDACAPCHSRRTALTKYFDPKKKYLDQYAPALISPRLYHDDGQIDEEVYVYGSFRQSKMYHRGVKCIDCHDPHSTKLKIEGNDLCMSCHEPDKYNVFGHTMHEQSSEGAKCMNCHMPGKFYMVNDYRHDHSFRAPRPDLGVKYGTPDACTNCHTDQTQEWAAAAIEDNFGSERPFHFAEVLLASNSGEPNDIARLAQAAGDTSVPSFVRASMIEKLSFYMDEAAFNAVAMGLVDEDPLVRLASINAFSYLSQEGQINSITPHLQDENRALRIAAARNMAAVPPEELHPDYASALSSAIVELRNALEANSDLRDGLFAYGMYLEKIGMKGKALEVYFECIEKDDLFNNARLNASALLNGMGRNEEALVLLEMIVQQEPESAHAHFALGLLQAEMNDMEASVLSLGMAASLDTTQSRYWYNYGLALASFKNREGAMQAYHHVLLIDPGHVQTLKGLTVLHWELGEKERAYELALRMQKLAPEDPEVLGMLSQLQKEVGQRK